jgi:polyphosphate glucokinase
MSILAIGPAAEPYNSGSGWLRSAFAAAFKRPAKAVNDAAMQALGGCQGGRMVFLGPGTGPGSTMIVDGIAQPMELAHLPHKKRTYQDYVGLRGLELKEMPPRRRPVDNADAFKGGVRMPDGTPADNTHRPRKQAELSPIKL